MLRICMQRDIFALTESFNLMQYSKQEVLAIKQLTKALVFLLFIPTAFEEILKAQ